MSSDADKRRASGRRVLKGGKITFHQLGTSRDCTIRNLPDTGACLIVTSQVGIPNEFNLVTDRDKAVRPCCVEWRSRNKIGVAFK